jgi:uncharacterized membrane protein YeaQ/YmgE (transglycosylase-associated protein family)
MLDTSHLAVIRRDQSLSKNPWRPPGEYTSEGEKKKMSLAFVMASVLGTLWAWIVWIVIGGLAGALADRLIQGDKLGILGNIVIGIVGSLIGGGILGLFGIGGEGILWTFLTAFLGAVLLLWLLNAITGGRGIGKRARG